VLHSTLNSADTIKFVQLAKSLTSVTTQQLQNLPTFSNAPQPSSNAQQQDNTPKNQVSFLRVRCSNYEIMIAPEPERDFLLISIQNPEAPKVAVK
jgi:hypothetical protein